MSVGDGIVWNEALPDNSTLAHQIDDYDRDLRLGVRSRMAREHIWTSSQTATSEGGHHQFITFQQQTGAPTLTTALTQVGALYVGSSAAGYPLLFENSAGSAITLVNSAFNIPVITTGTLGSIAICSSANPNSLIALAGSADGLPLITHSNTAAPSYASLGCVGGGLGDATHTQVTGTTDITASTEADMSDMTMTITTKGTKLLCLFSAPFAPYVNTTLNVYINIDSSNKRTGSIAWTDTSYLGGAIFNLAFQHIETGLTPGSHTIKIRWSGAGVIQKGSTVSARILTVLDLQ